MVKKTIFTAEDGSTELAEVAELRREKIKTISRKDAETQRKTKDALVF